MVRRKSDSDNVGAKQRTFQVEKWIPIGISLFMAALLFVQFGLSERDRMNEAGSDSIAVANACMTVAQTNKEAISDIAADLGRHVDRMDRQEDAINKISRQLVRATAILEIMARNQGLSVPKNYQLKQDNEE